MPGLVAGLVLSTGCSFPGVPQRDPLLPVPVRRPEIEVNADRAPEVLDNEHSLLRFRGRLADRKDPGRLERSGGRFAWVALVFELEPESPAQLASDEAPSEAMGDVPPDVATLRLSAPFGNLPLLRIGGVYRVHWEVVTGDSTGLPDVRLEIHDEGDRLLYLMASGSSLPTTPLIDDLRLKSAPRPAFHTDFEAGAGCRVRRRHYATRVEHPSLEAADAWLMPTDDLDLVLETGRWRLTVLDNSVALKGGCEKLVAQELAHRTIVLQFVE
ncbi:MAG: hypothetical protein ABIK09_16535 [Pseudomonadota bacterium]